MTENLDEDFKQNEVITVITAKEIKKKYLPIFQADPSKYYPTKIFNTLGFTRHQCTSCNKFFWSKSVDREICGDSSCMKSYTFIEKKVSLLTEHLTYAEAWKTFEKSFTNSRIPCTAIKRYPVVARWRNDVDYVAAGIYCFQPYCVTGELMPPANPLICPQFCVRFNDLDNIGITGRHYSGFIMLGIQVFNYPDNYKFFKEECVEFNYNWLTQELKVDPNEIIFMEDIWAGGGNMGPCVEYFVGGLEVGNMVFMEFKTFHDGSYEELPIKVIDTGIGLERIPWLINGNTSSYFDVFRKSYEFLKNELEINSNDDIWKIIGPKTCDLDVDENEDIQKTWESIANDLGLSVAEVKLKIAPLKDLFIVLDHTRSALMLISDGALPSNVGGGSNLRNIIRRSFAIMKKNKWFDKIGLDGYLKIFNYHKLDFFEIYGEFPEYKSFNDIIRIEYEKWSNTDEETKQKLQKLLKKKKGNLDLEDWYLAITAWGIPSDTISEISNLPIPDKLYYLIAEKQDKVGKKAEQVLYNTTHLPDTEELLYQNDQIFKFNANIVEVFSNINEKNKRNIIILNKTYFYPTSGGQQHDTGFLVIDDIKYEIINVEKVGKCILHFTDKELPEDISGKDVYGEIDVDRRTQLRIHHTATHVIFSACREILGQHVWQNGAKKTPNIAHLDITHYTSLTFENQLEIENYANKLILKNISISKNIMKKEDAELEYGFKLYQGGVVPGDKLRIVNIENTDVEACCGTHCDNTGEIGVIKIVNSKRIADGIVRLYYRAGPKGIEEIQKDEEIINGLESLWKVNKDEIVATGKRIFKDYKSYKSENNELIKENLSLSVRLLCESSNNKMIFNSLEPSPTIYFSYLTNHLQDIYQNKKAICFLGNGFVYAICFEDTMFDKSKIEEYLTAKKINFDVKKNNKKLKTKNILYENVIFIKSNYVKSEVLELVKAQGFILNK